MAPRRAPASRTRELVPLFRTLFRTTRTRLAAAVVGLAAASTSDRAWALPNSHATAVSTWDVRASSVVLGLGRAVSGDSEYTTASYSANFSSTSGVLSAQFGIHYLSYRAAADKPLSRGVSAGGVALLTFPLADRDSMGIPGQSLSLYLGGVPTALISKQRNFISVPLVLGVGLPYSPTSSITLTPWAELSPGLNFDTRIQEVSTESAVDSAMDGTLTREEVEDLVDEGFQIDDRARVGKRVGLSLSVHLGESFDVDVNVLVGAAASGAAAMTGALVFRWDSQVPGVIGERRRLAREGCGAVEERFRSCPAARRYVVKRAPVASPPGVRPTGQNQPAAVPGAAQAPRGADAVAAPNEKRPPAPPPRAMATTSTESDDDGESGTKHRRRESDEKKEAPRSVRNLPPLQAAPRK